MMLKLKGITLVELLVCVAMMAIMASIAMPTVSLLQLRAKESELRSSLREMRTALDRFNEDWRNGRISRLDDQVSENGYPRTLVVLVNGVESGSPDGHKMYYLRRVPSDPFAAPDTANENMWRLRGYGDDPHTTSWGGRDVYDVSTQSDRIAIDGTQYKDW